MISKHAARGAGSRGSLRCSSLAIAKTALCVALVVVSARAAASPAEAAPIDVRLKACEEKNPSTAGTIDCIRDAAKAWDDELNAVYASLRKELPNREREQLRAAQQQWLRYRDEEFKLIDQVYAELQGTMYLPMGQHRRMNVVKQRTLELQHYLRLLREHRPRR